MRTCGALIAGIALALGGCSGSGSPAPPPAPANTAPRITSPASASFVENGTGIAYQASASDAEGDPVTLSLAGTDAARFTINAAGEVRFVAPPNYEAPADGDGNNVYAIQIVAGDGKASVTQAVTITVTNSAEGIVVERVASGFLRPTALAAVPGQSGVIVAERGGAIYRLDPAAQQPRRLLATVDRVTAAPDQGVLAVAASPDFAVDGTFYAIVARDNGSIVVRQTYGNGNGWGEFIVGRLYAPSERSTGWLGIGPDRRLYAAVADPVGDDVYSYAQDASSLLGKLFVFSSLSFDPYAGATVAPPLTAAVLASGLGRPVGGSFFAGGLLLPDRGRVRNEVNLLPLWSGTVDNLGWPYREGTSLFFRGEPAGVVAPVLEYPVGNAINTGQAIIGGFVYRGGNASLAGTYVFADASGAIWTVPLAGLQRGTTLTPAAFERRDLDFVPVSGTITQPAGLVQDANGAIYIVCDNGDVFRATAS